MNSDHYKLISEIARKELYTLQKLKNTLQTDITQKKRDLEVVESRIDNLQNALINIPELKQRGHTF